MENSNLDKLLKRYVTGQVSEEEKIKIETWLEVRKTENVNEDLSKEDEERLFQKIISKEDSIVEIQEFQRRTSVTGWIFRIAAGLLVMALVSYLGWNLGTKDSGVTQIASVEGIEKVILNDGSLVWLKGKTELIYYKDPKEGIRYSELKGEALFEIAKDPDHPFVIQCGEVKLQVVGTSFSVKTGNDSLELKVLTGTVNLFSGTSKLSIDVASNKKILYTGNGKIQRLPLARAEASAVVENTEYNMQFNNTSLDQIVRQLQKKFDVVINIENTSAASCNITVDLTDQSLENSMRMITEVLDVEYHKNGNSITVSGQGCR